MKNVILDYQYKININIHAQNSNKNVLQNAKRTLDFIENNPTESALKRVSNQ